VAAEPSSSARRRLRRWLLLLAVLVIGVLAVRVLANSSGELLSAADNVTRLSPGWLAAAAAAEVLSYAALGAAQRRLLAAGGVRVGLIPITALGVAAQAGANCVPGGVAVSTVISFRRLNRRGVQPFLCGWMLSVSTLLYATVLALLALLGAQLAGSSSPSVPDLRPVSLVVVGLASAVGGLLVVLRHRRLPGRLLLWTTNRTDHAVARLRGRPAAPGAGGAWARQLRAVHAGPGRLLAVGALLAVCWLADGLCLALAFYALGSGPPWRGLLLSYCAAQLAASLPFTPGGLGVVEGSLTVALVAYGGAEQSALAAVLLYRLISFWGLIPVGALAYLGLRAGERRHEAAHHLDLPGEEAA